MTMNTNPNPAQVAPSDAARALVSALIDGELDGVERDRAIDALLASDDLGRFWHDCHRAGDWMRSDEVGHAEPCSAFMTRMSMRLADEPAIVAPRPVVASKGSTGFWMRTGLPSASVAAAIAVVAWVAIPNNHADAPLAVATPTIQPVSAPQGLQPAVAQVAATTPMDAEQVSDYLAAHGDVSPFAYRGAAARPANFVKPVVESPR